MAFPTSDTDIRKVTLDTERDAILVRLAQDDAVSSVTLETKFPGVTTTAKVSKEIELEKALIESLILDELGIIIGGDKVGDRTKSIRQSLKKLRSE